jgi:hypothetical protein
MGIMNPVCGISIVLLQTNMRAFNSNSMFTKKAFIIRRTATRYYRLVNIQLEVEKYFGVDIN